MNQKRPLKAKKTVSFSDAIDNLLPQLSLGQLPPHSVQFSSAVMLIPYHYLGIIWTLFKYYHFTKDPISALKRSLVLLVLLQIGYGYLIHSSIKKKKKQQINLLYIIAALLIAFSFSFLLFVILILFGAPFGSLSMQTYLLSLHLSLILAYPILITFKFVEFNDFKEYCEIVINQFNLKNEIYVICIGVVIGTWLGCFPIPLDWDRDWQTWPITLIVGAYLGGFLGGVVSLIIPLII